MNRSIGIKLSWLHQYQYYFFISNRIQNKRQMIGSLDKNASMGPEPGDSQPEFKKIQDYVYRFVDQIGMGNFSKVFKGVNQLTNKQVAIKLIELSSLSNNRLQELLNTETKILKMLSHPNVIGCEEILSSVRNCYIITELCDGGDLEKKLKKIGHFKEKQIYQIVLDVYEGLKYLSKKHIIHRDIKVSNIFIDKGVHKIADFGFAQVSQGDFRDISVGSPIYMSPEGYINNIYGPKTDVWAFGVLLYELIEGKTPCFDCRTESELKQCLMKQIDYSSFSSNVSSELKNLIIQCLEINPSLRIRVADIENTPWMKKAANFASDARKTQQKQNSITQLYRKQSEDSNLKHNNVRPQTPQSGTEEVTMKSYLNKFHNLLRSSQKEENEHKRKHSTLDKTTTRTSKDESEERKEEAKIFYSPKNTMIKIEKALGFANTNPNSKYQSFTVNHKINNADHSNLKIHVSKNDTAKANSKKEQKQNTVVKLKNTWLEKPKTKQETPHVTDNQKSWITKEKEEKSESNKLGYFQQIKQRKDEKGPKKTDKWGLINQYKNYLTSANYPKGSATNQSYQKPTPKAIQEVSHLKQKQKQLQHLEISKSGDQLRLKDPKHEKEQKKISKNQSVKVLNRKLRFGDCIGLIHYCRLCYKFACLLDEMDSTGLCQQNKIFLASWSVQLLEELKTKMEDSDILFNNESCLINNPSMTPGQIQKKKKLKDVTQQYLGKYQKVLKPGERNPISLKEASNYVYNLYLTKGHEFKEKTKEKKSYLYYALLAFISMLDRETRNLMEFVYEIKSSMEGRQVEKLLNVKISEFSQKIVDDITAEGGEVSMCQFSKK